MTHFHRNLRQTATYWAPTNMRDAYGKITYAAPVQLRVRWEDRVELFRDKHGNDTHCKSKVYLSEKLHIDGYLLLGTSTAADPQTEALAFEIQMLSVTPDLRNLISLTVAYL